MDHVASRVGFLVVLVVILVPGVEATERVVFTTSVTGNGNLGLWPDAGGGNGLAAADAICRSRATAAGLSDPNQFVAWLSDSSNDAYCRAHGFAGTKSGNCGGLLSLPTNAGPWVRTDGYPFAPRLPEALGTDGVIYGPPMLDEFGNQVAEDLVFTETGPDGVYAGSASAACGDWTSAGAVSIVIGSATGGTQAWTQSSSTLCSSNIALLCLHAGPGDPLPPHWRQGAFAFATSVAGSGSLGSWPESGSALGIAAGNAVCQAQATTAGLPDPASFRAWLSDSSHDASDQLSLDGPWTRLDGVPVANSLADLTDGQLLAPINLTDAGIYLGNYGLWTGTTGAGVAAANHCNDWQDGGSSSQGDRGSAYRSNSWWTHFGSPSSCSSWFHLYCFSNHVTSLLVDSFDSGDTTAWSSTVP